MVIWAVSWFGWADYPVNVRADLGWAGWSGLYPVNVRADLGWADWSGLAIFRRLVLLKELRKEFKLVFRIEGILPKASLVGANRASRMAKTRKTRKEIFILQGILVVRL